MTFKCRFNATCFLFKINRFVLIFSKTSNRFVLKICSGGFADYTFKKKKTVPKENNILPTQPFISFYLYYKTSE
jgi:hypothetical protein